jgi:hypothetical protein
MAAWSTAAFAANPNTSKVAPMPGSASWCIQPTIQSAIAFHGLDETEAGREGPDYMMYPGAAPGLAGALVSLAAGIATHGAIVGGMQAKHAAERAQKADQILAPYRATLDKFTTDRVTKELLVLRSDLAVCQHPPASGAWLVQLTPAFYLSQSQTSVIAEVVVSAAPTELTGKERPRATSVRVVSGEIKEREFADQWLADDGTVLAQRAALLVSEALDVAMRWEIHEADTATIPWATYRFAFGDREHMERAQQVAGDCHSSVLRTLRATYVVASMEAPNCVVPSASNSEQGLPPAPPEKRD